VRRGELPFVRLFARSLVRSFVCRRGVKRMTMGEQKSDDEGKEGTKIMNGQKIFF
jgi:hypothetical protein